MQEALFVSAVGQFYDEFDQTSDDEVIRSPQLARNRYERSAAQIDR